MRQGKAVSMEDNSHSHLKHPGQKYAGTPIKADQSCILYVLGTMSTLSYISSSTPAVSASLLAVRGARWAGNDLPHRRQACLLVLQCSIGCTTVSLRLGEQTGGADLTGSRLPWQACLLVLIQCLLGDRPRAGLCHSALARAAGRRASSTDDTLP